MAEGMELALGAMMFYGLADWVYKRAAASGVQAHHFLALQAFFFAPGIFLYGLATNTLALGAPFAWGMTAGVLIFVALYNFARSLASGAVSIVAPVFRLSFAITAALAVWLLDERLTGWKLAGLAASLAAVWLLLAGGPASAPRIKQIVVAARSSSRNGGDGYRELHLRSAPSPAAALLLFGRHAARGPGAR